MSLAGTGYLAAFAGGLASFASPCVLPVVPAYLSVITGLEISEIERGPRRHLGRIALDTSLFIAGFAAVFIMLGLGGGNTMRLTAFYSAGGRLLDVERGALVPSSALKIKIAQLFGVIG